MARPQIPQYSAGTIAIAYTNNVWTVTGSGTKFTSPDGASTWTIGVGDILVCGGKAGVIGSIVSDTSLTLDSWNGSAVAAGTAYKINRYSGVPNSAIYGLYQQLIAFGSALNPFPALAAICGSAAKILFDTDASGNVAVKVRPTTGGKTDADFVTALTLNPTTGAASFAVPPVSAAGALGMVMPDITATVGADGTISDSLTFKNLVRNGAFDVAQRGTLFTAPASNTYTFDGWKIYWGGATVRVEQISQGNGNAVKLTGAAGNTTTSFYQNIEAQWCQRIAGGPATFGAVLSASSAMTVRWTLKYATASDNFAGVTQIATGTFAVTTTPKEFSVTVATMPDEAANGVQLIILPNNGGAFASGWLTITDVSLERGSQRTEFEHLPMSIQLQISQRYYETTGVLYWGYGSDWAATSEFKVTKRTTSPSVSLSSIVATNSNTITTSGVNANSAFIHFNISPTGSGAVSATMTVSAEL